VSEQEVVTEGEREGEERKVRIRQEERKKGKRRKMGERNESGTRAR
jgi:ribosomal protein L21